MSNQISRVALTAALILCAGAFGAQAQTHGKAGAGSVAGSTNSGSSGTGGASGTIGSGGAAATPDTSATTLGTAGTSTGAAGTGSSLATGGSAAATDGRVDSRTKIHDNANNLMGQSKAMANEGGGDWSKSQTKTQVKPGDELSTRTKTMSHEPGGAPTKSTTTGSVDLNR